MAEKPDTADKVQRVLARMEAGESETAACKAENIPRLTFRMAAIRVGAQDHYARALESMAMVQVEKLEETIQEMRDGLIPPDVARIEIDARKWFASRLFKPTWGDKASVEVTGKDGGAIQTEDVSDETRAKAILAVLAKAQAAQS